METKRLAIGFGWGVVATLAMSAVMVTGYVTGIAPMPDPIPGAVVGRTLEVLGIAVPGPAVMILGAISHLAYGGFWGAVLAGLTRPVSVWKGLGLGVFLWIIMDIAVLPFLGWGFFGVAITPRIAVATLILHLIYGFTLGLLMDRGQKE